MYNAVNNEGCTALHVAARYGYLNIVKMLSDHETNINTETEEENSPSITLQQAKQKKITNTESLSTTL